MERTTGVPEGWHLVSAEIDGNGLVVDLRRVDGRTLTLSFLVTSEEALFVQERIQHLVRTAPRSTV